MSTASACAPGDVEQEIHLHGQRFTYLEHGSGPVVVLLHGLAGSSATWLPVLPLIGEHAHVIAPDLLGHGRSAKPRSGDYSIGAYAASLRDLLLALGHDRATIVGHSFGGGVAMQFAYQFPELTERLVLVASGGLGSEVTLALRAATLPGSTLVLKLLADLTPQPVGRFVHQVLRRTLLAATDVDEFARAITSMADQEARNAFVHATRGVLDIAGQRLDATGKLYLTEDIPLMLIGGRDDSCIPVEHSVLAHQQLPGSRLELFDHSGHFPHADDPYRFAHTLLDFLATTQPAQADTAAFRHRLRAAGSPETPH
jgi:pimeloyl-ACP methyl ester carboxylesterase